MASIEVISTSVHKLLKFWKIGAPAIELSQSTEVMLVAIILLKLVLYIWCVRVARNTNNESVKAIAQDNQNDVFSNSAALLAAKMTNVGEGYWVVDPIVGILISLYIIYTWLRTGYEQVEMIVG